MKSSPEILVVSLTLFAGAWLMFAQPKARSASTAVDPLALPASTNFGVTDLAARLPLVFEQNSGQRERSVKFLSRQNSADLLLTSSEAIARFREDGRQLRMKFAGSNPDAKIEGTEPLPGHQNYLLGSNSAKWTTNVPTFRTVIYEEIYPRTNLIFYGNNRELEYDFKLSAGADPKT